MTVVVPTFNRAGRLGGAVESVLSQTYRDFRLVVSDNASTDATAEVVAGFDDPRLTYVRQPRHLELNAHWNRWLHTVGTDYLFLLPDDDRMLPELLETAVPVLDAHPSVGLVHGRVRNVDEQGRVIADDHDMTGGLAELTIESGRDFVRRSIAGSHRVHASTALVRRAALAGLWLDARDFPATDFGLWLRLALSWDVAFVPRTLAVYCIHGASYTSDGAGVAAGGYVQGVELITAVRDVKRRVLAEHGSWIGDRRRMERLAERSFRVALLNRAGHVTLPERRIGATVSVLADAVRRAPATLLEPAAWRLLAASLLGRRVVDRIKRRRAGAGVAAEAVSR